MQGPTVPLLAAGLFFAALTLGAHGARAQAPEIPADSPIRAGLEKAESAVHAIVSVPAAQRKYENTIGAIDDMLVRLDDDTSMTLFMQHVSTNADEREASSRAEQDYQNWMISLTKREDLYNAVKGYADTKPALEGERARLLTQLLRDFRRAGMALPADKRERLKQIQMETAKLGIDFEKNIRDDETRVPLTRDELKGMPEEMIGRLPQSGGLYLVGMDNPTFMPLMDLCESEVGRQKTWLAYKRRGGKKNVALLEKIIKLRAEASALLGYASTVDFETEPRMAKNAANVKKFYDQVRPLVRKKAQLDFAEFTDAKRRHTGDPGAKLYPWDYSFYKNRLMREKYAVDTEKVREYLPMERVVDGLFSITQSLYGIEYRDVTAEAASRDRPIWHPDVKLFEVKDKATSQVLGEFYLDLYPRENKYNHAAQWGLRSRKLWPDGTVQRPLAALVCNFTKPTPDKPSLLDHGDEVETFFHEFGHCLHTILTETQHGWFAGTSVARDFVEAPSQMFENWVWDAKVLGTFARHYKTGEPLPKELLDGLIKAQHVGSGIEAEHQFYYGLCDYEYHIKPDGVVDTTKIANDLFAEVELYEPVPNIYYQASFGHLVGYQAGYYGYQWSLVYACDMFQRFKELGMLSPEAGMYYRKKVLGRGGTMDELDMVKDYLGREPNMDAYLEHLGLSEK